MLHLWSYIMYKVPFFFFSKVGYTGVFIYSMCKKHFTSITITFINREIIYKSLYTALYDKGKLEFSNRRMVGNNFKFGIYTCTPNFQRILYRRFHTNWKLTLLVFKKILITNLNQRFHGQGSLQKNNEASEFDFRSLAS